MEQPASLTSFCVDEVLKSVKCIREVSVMNLHPFVFNFLMKSYWLLEMGEIPRHPGYHSLNCYCLPPVHYDGFDDWFGVYRQRVQMSYPCDIDHWML